MGGAARCLLKANGNTRVATADDARKSAGPHNIGWRDRESRHFAAAFSLLKAELARRGTIYINPEHQ